MSRFHIFNSPAIGESQSSKPMEIDSEDLAQVYDKSLSIDLPRDNQSVYVSSQPPIPVFPLSKSVVQGNPDCESHSSSRSERPQDAQSFLNRILSLIADVDEETMHRIALVPYMMSGYIQLMFNISLPAIFLYWIYSFGQTIQSDVEKKVLLFSEEVMEQIAKCSRDYRDNRCDPSTRVPALVSACQAWEECMARDPHLVAKRSGIAAEIFGETLNSFFNVLSWKAIASLILLVLGVAALFNITFSMTKRSTRLAVQHDEADPGHPFSKQIRKQSRHMLSNGAPPSVHHLVRRKKMY